jgi:hypothetical protein
LSERDTGCVAVETVADLAVALELAGSYFLMRRIVCDRILPILSAYYEILAFLNDFFLDSARRLRFASDQEYGH